MLLTRTITRPSYGNPAPSPTVAEIPSVQTTLPTSAYGQTIPVVYGKAKLPAAYIWVPPILTITSTHIEYWDTITRTTAKMSARLRFARPLVPDSTWSLRKLYANGKVIYDGTTGYRQKGLNFRFYDGRSTQGRDPTMVTEEGETDVSAHRGYIDLVVKDFDIIGLGAPPVFEAEIIQDGVTAVDVDSFQTFYADTINTFAAVDWDSDSFYGFSDSSNLIRRFSISFLREIYAIEINGLGRAYTSIAENLFRYIPEIDRLLAVPSVPGGSGGAYPILLDPISGTSVAEAVEALSPTGLSQGVNASVSLMIGGTGILMISAFHLGYVSIYTFSADAITRASLSGTTWDGRGRPECFAPGEIRDGDADIWICAGNSLWKNTVNTSGLTTLVTEHATFVDDLVYAVWHDDDVIVWTDNAEAIRIDGVTGAVVWTMAVPYQIPAASLQRIAPPDANRLDDELLIAEGLVYYFTNLDTGLTRSLVKGSSAAFRYVFDGVTDTMIRTDNATLPARDLFDPSGDGTQRDLSDFLEALMAAGGFDSAEVQTVNIDDVIDGAVIDVTAGVRDIARATCEPYSIAIFERSGTIIFKRAATDGGFAVDATLSSAGDISDNGGQAIRARRLNPEEFIARYGINYRDQDEVYQSRPQYGEIPTLPFPVAPSDMAVKANIPIIADADTIKVLATQKVNRMAIERHEFQLTLRAKYSDSEPEDIIRFVFAGRTITARVLETTLRPDYMIDAVATEFLSSVSVSISGAIGRPTEPEPVGTPASRYHHLDIPLLSEGHDLGGAALVQYHVLASAGQPYWDGATLFRKDADGLYQPVAGQTTNGLVGIALEALPDWDIPYVTEFTRTLDLAFVSGDTSLLASATYLEMMNGANFFAIGQPGRWEVCQVMTITPNGDGSYTFEGLRRGRKSSEEYTGLHAVGDFVVWLSEENVQRIDYAIASLDDAFDFKPVGFGGDINTTPAVNRTVSGEAEKIPKPCHLDASIDSPSDVRLSWIRRSRIGAYWTDDGEDTYATPLGETLEQYVVRIKDGPGGTVLRTLTVNDATHYDYSGALQTTDFGSPLTSGDQLTFDIRQVSGTGVICPTREATIDL